MWDAFNSKEKKNNINQNFLTNVQILKTRQLGVSLPSQQEFDQLFAVSVNSEL